jgi:tetratricopeptide (TPR) repeat protein
MIVKDEAHVIERCLDSVKPLIDYWVIVDTGSSDNTRELIKAKLEDLPGELHDRPWVNFGHNRTEALQLARGKADYIFVIDADDWVEHAPELDLSNLDADAYLVKIVSNKNIFRRFNLFTDQLNWYYDYVIHEQLKCNTPFTKKRMTGLTIRATHEGARNRDPEKCAKAAVLIEDALKERPDEPCYYFYLGQSYRDSGQLDNALIAYRKRIELGGQSSEVWYSHYMVAQLSDRLEHDSQEVVSLYLKAHEMQPARAEPLGSLSSHLRKIGMPASALVFARQAAALPLPDGDGFIERAWYSWRSFYEVVMSAHQLKDLAEVRHALSHLMIPRKLPRTQREELEKLGLLKPTQIRLFRPSLPKVPKASGCYPRVITPPTKLDDLYERAWQGALFLANHMDRRGRFTYTVNLRNHQRPPGYNIVRHCGCAWSVLDVYQDTGDSRLLTSGQEALAYIRRVTQPFHEGLAVCQGNKCHTGSNALAILAFCKMHDINQDQEALEFAGELVEYLLKCLTDDGELLFHIRDMETPETDNGKRIAFYPGEACLALAVYASKTKDERAANSARKIINWLNLNRDSKSQAQDHWLLQALEYFGRDYQGYASRIAHEMMANPGYLKNHYSTPVACRSEALISYYAMTFEEEVREFIMQLLECQVGYQVVGGRYHGGFINRYDDPILRNDYTQHNISSFIRFWRVEKKYSGK